MRTAARAAEVAVALGEECEITTTASEEQAHPDCPVGCGENRQAASGRGGTSRLVRLAGDGGPQVVAVHQRDELDADLLGAGGLALVVVGAVAEPLLVHL